MKQIYLKFLPLLFFYLFLVAVLSSNILQNDEVGYVAYANRLIKGIDSSQDDFSLWWGPGYPIVLTPFLYLKIPFLVAKFLNSFFLFGAVLYFYKTINLYIQNNYVTILTYCLGLYPPLLREIHLLVTENLVFFLVCGFMFHFCKLCRYSGLNWFHLLIASLYLGYLALTKVFFGYVMLVGILLYLFLFILQRKKAYLQTTFIYVLALVWCTPYLLMTYSLTNKIFYWGSSGGLSLYWMSTPYENEFGDWFSAKDVQERVELSQHRDFFDEIDSLSEVEQDDAFKKKARFNIINNPLKYAINWMANIGRLLFSYPFSYTSQKLSTYFYIIPNMFIVVLLVLSIYPSILKRKVIPYEIYTLILFALIAFGGTSLLSGFDRQFRPFVPIILLWLSFVYFRIMNIELGTDAELSLT